MVVADEVVKSFSEPQTFKDEGVQLDAVRGDLRTGPDRSTVKVSAH